MQHSYRGQHATRQVLQNEVPVLEAWHLAAINQVLHACLFALISLDHQNAKQS